MVCCRQPMKKILDKKSLHLARETVRSLSEHELVRAGGGAPAISIAKDTGGLPFTCVAYNGCNVMAFKSHLFGIC
jgi:hypothetical protein